MFALFASNAVVAYSYATIARTYATVVVASIGSVAIVAAPIGTVAIVVTYVTPSAAWAG